MRTIIAVPFHSGEGTTKSMGGGPVAYERSMVTENFS